MRLIDADALKIVAQGKNHHRRYIWADITDAPTIEAEPVKHGWWFDLRDCANQGTYCSVCKAKIFDTLMPHKKKLSNFCPHCGARMEVNE